MAILLTHLLNQLLKIGASINCIRISVSLHVITWIILLRGFLKITERISKKKKNIFQDYYLLIGLFTFDDMHAIRMLHILKALFSWYPCETLAVNKNVLYLREPIIFSYIILLYIYNLHVPKFFISEFWTWMEYLLKQSLFRLIFKTLNLQKPSKSITFKVAHIPPEGEIGSI